MTNFASWLRAKPFLTTRHDMDNKKIADIINEKWNALPTNYDTATRPVYADVDIRFKDEEEGQTNRIICVHPTIENTEDYENDDEVFYYVKNLAELLELAKEDNGEDFDITFVHDIYPAEHDDDFYDKEFKGGLIGTTISRGELESLPEPFRTANVSDETMQKIIDDTEVETLASLRLHPQDFSFESRESEKWWAFLESNCRYYGVPYYDE